MQKPNKQDQIDQKDQAKLSKGKADQQKINKRGTGNSQNQAGTEKHQTKSGQQEEMDVDERTNIDQPGRDAESGTLRKNVGKKIQWDYPHKEQP
jgi:hypothetical protein